MVDESSFCASDQECTKEQHSRAVLEALRGSDALQRAIIEGARDGIMIADAETMKFSFVNSSAAEITGYTVEELMGMGLENIHPPDSLAFVKGEFEQQVRGEKGLAMDIPVLRKDGSVIYCDINTQVTEIRGRTTMIGVFRDIAERRQRMQDIKGLLEGIPDIVVRFDSQCIHTYVSPNVKAVFGVPAEDIIGKTQRDLGLPEQLCQELEGCVQTAFRTGSIAETEFAIETPLGTKCFNWRVIPELQDEGSTRSVIALARDVTEIKDRESDLERHAYLLEKAQELGEIGTWELDIVNNELTLTDQTCEIFGVPKGSLVTYDTFISRVHPDDREYVETEWRAAIDGKPYEVEHRIVAGGKTRRVRQKADLSFDDEGVATRAIGFVQDITDRAMAVAELRESEERLRTLFECAPDGYFITDLKGTFIDGNRAAEELIGRQRGELIGTSYAKAGLLDMSQLGRALRLLSASVLGKPTGPDEFTLHRKDGTTVDVEIRSLPVKIGGKRCVLGSARDISQRKRSEVVLRETNVRLEQALQDLAEAQSRVVEQERLGALGRMASGIAHDFNNVLMPIVGFSELILSEPGILREQEEEVLAMLEKIRCAGEDARQIVRRLRMIRRPSGGDAYDIVDMASIVRTAVDLTVTPRKAQMEADGVSVDVVVNLREVQPVMGNETELREVIMNLMINAIDAMPNGGSLTLSVANDGAREVLVKVQDSGRGMTRKELDSCIEPFYTTKGEQGTGLGLAMSHGILERHGGTLHIESKPDMGTSVEIRLPTAGTSSEDGISAVSHRVRVGGTRVLAIDDDSRSRTLILRLLQALGCSVSVVSSGTEGLAEFKNAEFDIVLTDQAMPNMSGTEVAKKIKAIREDVPVLMITGFGDIMLEKKELPECVDAIIPKPLTHDELGAAIARWTRDEGNEQEKEGRASE